MQLTTHMPPAAPSRPRLQCHSDFFGESLPQDLLLHVATLVLILHLLTLQKGPDLPSEVWRQQPEVCGWILLPDRGLPSSEQFSQLVHARASKQPTQATLTLSSSKLE